MVDIIVIGGGPAGLTAAVYARRAGKSVLVLEKDALGGQITWSPKVENYPAVPAVSGMDLGNRMAEQAMDMGAEVEIDEVLRIEDFGSHKRVYGSFGTEYDARAVILAAGAKPRKLGLKREDELVGSGVGYCAVCDGAFFKGQAVAVNGGGNSALQDAVLLSDLCSRVYLVHRRDSFRGEEALVNLLRGKENVEFVLNAVITGPRSAASSWPSATSPTLLPLPTFWTGMPRAMPRPMKAALQKPKASSWRATAAARRSVRSRLPPPTAPSPPSPPAPGWTGK